MVCLNADQFAENFLESSGADVKRSRLEEVDSVIHGPLVSSRPDEAMSTVTTQGEIPTVHPPALPPEEHVLRSMSARESTQDQSLLVRN